jgi:hypothetical protein
MLTAYEERDTREAAAGANAANDVIILVTRW